MNFFLTIIAIALAPIFTFAQAPQGAGFNAIQVIGSNYFDITGVEAIPIQTENNTLFYQIVAKIEYNSACVNKPDIFYVHNTSPTSVVISVAANANPTSGSIKYHYDSCRGYGRGQETVLITFVEANQIPKTYTVNNYTFDVKKSFSFKK